MRNLLHLLLLVLLLPFSLAYSNNSASSLNSTSLGVQIADLQSQIADLQNQLGSLNLTNLSAETIAQASNEPSLQTKIAELQDQLLSLTEQINSLQQEEQSLRESIDTLQSSLTDAQDSVAGISSVLQMAKSKIEEFPSPEKILSNLPMLLIGSGALISIFLGLGIANTLQLRRIAKKPKLTQEQKNKISSYISFYRSRNYPPNSIKQGLLKQGWTENQIEEAMGAA